MSTTTHRNPYSSTATTTMLLVVLVLVGWSALSPVAAQTYTDGALFRQQFETTTAATAYSFGGKATVTNGILRASYIPDDRGSPRLTKHSDLNKVVATATLSYDLKLNKNAVGADFEFVKGGKLHGLGGNTTTTGCDPIDPKGWSVRLMWRTNGVPNLYVYHQDRLGRCGTDYPAVNFVLTTNVWYRIDLQVKMNSAATKNDGAATLFIDGIKRAEATNLRLTGDDTVRINKFLFSTFYGGDDPAWKPQHTNYIDFDNFSVMPGLIVTGSQGKECEINKAGIYSFKDKACCAKGCGSCGGTGCGSLPGGSTNCCSGSITKTCSTSSSPCKYSTSPVVPTPVAPVPVPVPVPAPMPVPTPVVVPAPVVSNVCASGQGLAAVDQCTAFVHCVSGQVLANSRTPCAAGTLFSNAIQVCDWTANVVCGTVPAPAVGPVPVPLPAAPAPRPVPVPAPVPVPVTGSTTTCAAGWKPARWTYYISYAPCCPGYSTFDPNADTTECTQYNACQWAGWFAYVAGQQTVSWVQTTNIVSFYSAHGDNASYGGGKTIEVQAAGQTVKALLADTCGDNDCSDGACCTNNAWSNGSGYLVDMEYHTLVKYFGSTTAAQGTVCWRIV
jgi:hypothetical protein